MEKKKGILFILVLAAALVVAILFSQKGPSVTFFTENGPVAVPVEVADSPQERTQGLMFRQGLEGGMLFVFEGEQGLDFWMKNTLIPLDMIFISKDLEVVAIRTAVPCQADPCPLYSGGVAQYVVEVNAGFAEENGIREGDRVEIRP